MKCICSCCGKTFESARSNYGRVVLCSDNCRRKRRQQRYHAEDRTKYAEENRKRQEEGRKRRSEWRNP
jgi:hypothetical protein